MSKKGKKNNKFALQFLIQYQERVLMPVDWIKQADELILASKKLEPSIRKYWITVSKYFDPKKGTYDPPLEFKPKKLLQSTYFMLVAYAIENYFKSVLIAKFKTKYKSEILHSGKLPESLKKHNLMELAEQTNFTPSEIETSLLTRLSRNSVWQGRYPVPVDSGQLNSVSIHKGIPFFTAFFALPDISNLNTLIRRLRKVSTKDLSPDEILYLKL